MSCKGTLTKYSGNCNWMNKLFRVQGNNTPSTLLTGLLAYWSFDNTLEDLTGNGYDATAFNSPAFVEDAIFFNNPNYDPPNAQYLTTPHVSVGDNHDFTFGVWLKWEVSQTYSVNIIESFTFPDYDSGFFLDFQNVVSDARWIEIDNNNTGERSDTFGQINPSEWVFVLFGYELAQQKLFINVNGTGFDYSGVTDYTDIDATMAFANCTDPTQGNPYNGYIKKCGVWNRLLTDDEITTLLAGATYPF